MPRNTSEFVSWRLTTSLRVAELTDNFSDIAGDYYQPIR